VSKEAEQSLMSSPNKILQGNLKTTPEGKINVWKINVFLKRSWAGKRSKTKTQDEREKNGERDYGARSTPMVKQLALFKVFHWGP